jgi:hypothetical protein
MDYMREKKGTRDRGMGYEAWGKRTVAKRF